MILLELHVYNSGAPVAINPDTVSQVGSMESIEPDGTVVHGIIHRLDGGSVEVLEPYEEVCRKVAGLRGWIRYGK